MERSRAGDGASSARHGTRVAYRRNVGLLAVLGLLLVVGSAAAVLINESVFRSARSEALHEVRDDARANARQLDRYVSDHITTLQAIANAIQFGTTNDRSLLTTILDRIGADRLGFSGGIGWAGRDGRLTVSTNAAPTATPVSIADRDYFARVIATGQQYVSDVILGRRVAAPLVVIAVPTHDSSGTLSGVLTGSFRLDRDLRRRLPGLESNHGTVFVVDRRGTIVAAGEPVNSITTARGNAAVLAAARTKVGVRGSTTGTLGTNTQVVGYAPATTSGWRVFVETDRSTLIGTLERRRFGLLVTFATLAIVGGVLVSRTALRIRRDHRSAERSARDAELLAAAGSVLDAPNPDPVLVLDAACRAIAGHFALLALAYSVRDGRITKLAVASHDPRHQAVLDTLRGPAIAIDADAPHALAARTGAVVRADGPDSTTVMTLQRELAHSRDSRSIALRSVEGPTIAVPFSTALEPGAAPTHVLVAALPIAPQTDFDDDDVAVVSDLAQRCRASLRMIELRRDAELSRDRAESLQALSAALAAAVTTSEIVEAIAEHAAATVDADTVHIGLPGPGATLRLLHDRRADAEHARRWDAIELDLDAPLTNAYRGTAQWVDDVREVRSRPIRNAFAASGIAAFAAIPLHDSAGGCTAAIGFSWGIVQRFDDRRRALVHAVIAAIEPAFDRAALTEQLQLRRRRAETRARLAATLAMAAGTEEVVRVIAAHGMAVLDATGIVVTLADERRNSVVVRAVGGSIGTEAVGDVIDLDSSDPLATTLRRNEPIVAPADPEQPDRTVVALPLLAGNATVGTMRVYFRPLAHAESFDRDELAVFGSQVAQAVARARLFDSERERRARIEHQRHAATALAQVATVEGVANAAVAHARTTLGAMWAAVWLRADDRPDELVLLTEAGPRTGAPTLRVPAAEDTPAGYAIRTGRQVHIASRADMQREFPTAYTAVEATNSEAWLVLPIGETPYGVLTMAFATPDALSLDRRLDIDTFHRLCERAFARARRFDAEHEIATVLQASLLPGQLDDVRTVRASARYRAGRRGTIVGGDWYDVVEIGEGRVALVVGDVVGRGPRAAAAMGQLRIAVRTLAPYFGPADLLTRVDAIAERLPDAQLATVAYLLVDTAAGTLRWSLAGHPPPLIVRHGRAEYLHGGRSTPLAAVSGIVRPEASTSLAGITRALLYTDGLVERRTVSLDEQLDRLTTMMPTGDETASTICDRIIEAMLDSEAPTDDVAVLCAEIPADPTLDVVVPGRADQLARLRGELRGWLTRLSVPDTIRGDILVAAGEACANSVEHGYRNRSGPVHLRAVRHDGQIIMSVIDEGDWRPPQDDPTRGRGLRILNATMDCVEIQRSEQGTEIRLARTIEP